MDELAPATPLFNVNRNLVHSSIWMVSLRWTLRGIGVVNTFILARLLMPEDFGLVAMATLVIGLVEVFGQTGQSLALIRHPNPTREHYDTVWTVSIMVGAAITVILWLLSPLSAYFFHEQRAILIVQILSIRAFIGGFENIGVVAFRKDLQFSKEFSYQVAQRIISFVATIGIALWLRSYWALVVGILGSRIITVGVSYLIHPYRPRFCLTKVYEIWSFSTWMLIVHVAQFLQDKTDEFVVGNVTNTETMGDYNVAADIATAPTIELVLPTTQALFPIFSRISGNLTALTEAYLNVFSVIAIIVCATATGVTLVAHDFVVVTLGPNWIKVVPLVEWLAMSGAFYSIMQGAITLISATGHGRLSATLAISRTLLTIPVVIAAAWFGTVETIAASRTVITALFIPGIFFALARILPLRVNDLLSRLWRPVLAACVMAITLTLCHPLWPELPQIRLFLEAGLGGVTFLGAMLILWRLAGKPPGPECATVSYLTRRFTVKPALPKDEVPAGAIRIFVISTFTSHTEGTPQYRTRIGWIRNRCRRLFDQIAWTLGMGWHFHFSTYQDKIDSNRGDSAIRQASIQLLRKAFASPVAITEFGWEEINEDFVTQANHFATIVVIAGGGYLSCNAQGELASRLMFHSELFRQLDCPLIGLGLGLNCLLSQRDGLSLLAAKSSESINHFVDCMALYSVRDTVTGKALALGSRLPPVIPDPALFLDRKEINLPVRQVGDGHWIGLNLAFHGPASTIILSRLFPIVVNALQEFQRVHPCRFLYFVHSDAERLLPRLLSRCGIRTLVVNCPPNEMLSWYRLLDIHLCEMLHSAILASNAGVPYLNLAYDIKNLAFCELIGSSECLPADTVTTQEIFQHLNKILEERDVRHRALVLRKTELRRDLDRFMTLIPSQSISPQDQTLPSLSSFNQK